MSIKKNIIVVYSTQVLTIAITFISSIFLSRILGTEGRGEQALFSNSISFCSLFFGFSISSTITFFLNSGKISIEKLFFSLLLFSVFTSTLLFSTLYYLRSVDLLGLALPSEYHQLLYILLFAVSYFFTLYAGILNSFLISNKVFRKQSLLALLPNLILLLVYVLIYYRVIKGPHWNNFNLVIFAFLFTSFSNFAIMYVVFRQEITFKLMFSVLSIREIKMFVRYSFLAYVGNVAQFLSYRMDIWTVDRFCGKSQLGIYSQAIMLLQMLWVLPNTLSTLLYSYASSSNFEAIREKSLQLIRLSVYSTFLISIFFLLFSYFMVPLLFGMQFTYSVDIIFILVSGYFVFSLPTTASSLFAAYGHFRITFLISVFTALISSVLYYFMTKSFGLSGAAMASNFSYFTTTFLCILALKKYFNIRFAELFYIRKDLRYLINYLKSYLNKPKTTV